MYLNNSNNDGEFLFGGNGDKCDDNLPIWQLINSLNKKNNELKNDCIKLNILIILLKII